MHTIWEWRATAVEKKRDVFVQCTSFLSSRETAGWEGFSRATRQTSVFTLPTAYVKRSQELQEKYNEMMKTEFFKIIATVAPQTLLTPSRENMLLMAIEMNVGYRWDQTWRKNLKKKKKKQEFVECFSYAKCCIRVIAFGACDISVI